MALAIRERSSYYRGLLVLVRKDRIVDSRERELMLRIGTALDFDIRCCEAAVDDVLHNKYINDDPVIFHDRETAECFLLDGLRLAAVDGEVHPKELEWLKRVARANHVDDAWLDAEIARVSEGTQPPDRSFPLAIQQHL